MATITLNRTIRILLVGAWLSAATSAYPKSLLASLNMPLSHDVLGRRIAERADTMSDKQISLLVRSEYSGPINLTTYHEVFDTDHSACISSIAYGTFCSIVYYDEPKRSFLSDAPKRRVWIVVAQLKQRGNQYGLEFVGIHRHDTFRPSSNFMSTGPTLPREIPRDIDFLSDNLNRDPIGRIIAARGDLLTMVPLAEDIKVSLAGGLSDRSPNEIVDSDQAHCYHTDPNRMTRSLLYYRDIRSTLGFFNDISRGVWVVSAAFSRHASGFHITELDAIAGGWLDP